MKKMFTLSFFALSILSVMQSCQKHGDGGSKHILIDTTLSSGVEYKLNLQQYGDRDDIATIRTQATNYTTSEITNVSGEFAPVYHYVGVGNSKLAVTDQVVLAITEGNRGGNNCNHHNDSTIVTINFTVK